MPTFEVKSPDGRVFEITAPDGATQDQVLAYAQSQWKKAPQFAPIKTAWDEAGPIDALTIAAGRSTDKIVDGVRQLYNKAVRDDKTLAEIDAKQKDNDAAYSPLKAARPVATGIGEAVPSLAVPVGSVAGAGSFILKSALAGAAPGALSYGSADERMKAAALGGIGGALGGGIGLGIGRAIRPAGAAGGGISKTAQEAADELGLSLTAGQKTLNPALMNFENYLSRSPGSSSAMQAKAAANQTKLNTAAASAMGQKSSDVGEGTFSAAKAAIGSEFDRLGGVTSPKLGNDFLSALAKIDADNAARGAFKSKAIDGLIDKGLDLAAKGNLTGKAYKEIRTAINNEAQSAFKGGDATYGQALKTVRDALDDAAKASLSKADQEAWDVARKQWAAYKVLSSGNVSEAGNVSAARVASKLRNQNDMFRAGQGGSDLANIARIGEAIKAVQNPNSGQLVNQMMYGNPVTGLPMMLGNKAAQSVYMSKPVQSYLANGLLDIGQPGLTFIGRASIPFGAPVAQSLLGAQ